MSDGHCFTCSESFDSCGCDRPETFSLEKPHCPHCGAIHEDDDPNPDYYSDGEFDMSCNDCGEDFNVAVYVSYSYTCARKG